LFALVLPFKSQAQDFWVPAGLDGMDVTCMAAAPNGAVFAGSAGHGLYRMAAGGAWQQVLDPARDITCIAVAGNGSVFIGLRDSSSVLRSTDNGDGWTQLPALNGPVTALTVNAAGFVYAGATYISWSENNGGRWADMPWFKYRGSIQSLAIHWSGLLFGIPTANGDRVVRSTDHSNWWDESFLRKGCRALAIDPGGRIFVAADSGVYRSDNASDTWKEMNNGLATRNLRCIALPKRGELFVGAAGGGVYHSIDSAATWMAVNAGLGNLELRSLALAPDGFLYAGTARGVYRSARTTTDAPAPVAIATAPALEQNYPNPVATATAIAYTLPRRGRATLAVYDMLGRRVAVLADAWQAPGRHVARWDASALPAGMYLCRLDAAGISRSRVLSVAR
jgi:photosystem II stability/assembly factor-like uncharacterized protein